MKTYRVIVAGAVIIMSAAMCGCGLIPELPALTEEETQLVTEYAAGLLLEHDINSSGDNLLDEEELAKGEALEAEKRQRDRDAKAAAEDYLAKKANAGKDKKEKDKAGDENAPDESSKAESSNQTVNDLASFYGMDAFSISYKDYVLTDSYPESGEDMLMAMDATPGSTLCVLKFDVTNISGSDATFDMFYRSPNFYLKVNGMDQVHQQYTLLLDDMAAGNDLFAAGSTEERVLIFEVSDSVTDVESMSLTAKNPEGLKGTMPLK